MNQQTGKYILKKCISCGEYFALYRYGKQHDLCKTCRTAIYKDKIFIRAQAANKLAARRKRDEYLAERDAKAPAVAVTTTTKRNSLGATIICESRGKVPGGNRCTFNRY